MRAQPLKYWEKVRSSFWFLPSILVTAAIGLAFAVVAYDEGLSARWLATQGWIYTRSAQGASTILGTIAGSMITIAGVVFSLTLVSLTLATSQFGPRLLRNFMRDTVNQVVIGAFVATFLYCLVVLRAVRREEDGGFVPHLSVAVAVLLALASVGILIYFIHHVAVSIQADQVVARVAGDLFKGIDRLFPERIGRDSRAGDPAPLEDAAHGGGGREVESRGDGYVQIVDPDALFDLALREDLLVRLERRPGDYLMTGTVIATVWPAERATTAVADVVRGAFVLGSERTGAQDVEYSIHQLVEIALRALSPGVNDPFTALTCVDRLGSGLRRLAGRRIPTRERRDEGGRVRVIAEPRSFADTLEAAFAEIRMAASGSRMVGIRILEALASVADAAHRPEDVDALRRHADLVARGAVLRDGEDRRRVEEQHRLTLDTIEVAKSRIASAVHRG